MAICVLTIYVSESQLDTCTEAQQILIRNKIFQNINNFITNVSCTFYKFNYVGICRFPNLSKNLPSHKYKYLGVMGDPHFSRKEHKKI